MTTVPREITGSVGSRIRLIFGDDGYEWLLLLDHDDGDTQWQETDWRGIPHAVAKQMNNCSAKDRDIKRVDFGPDGAWFINGEKPDGSGNHSWWGNTNANDDIEYGHRVSFGTDKYGCETYILIDGRNGYSSSGIHKELSKRVERINNANQAIDYIRLFHDNFYFISDDWGEDWKLPSNLSSEVDKSGSIEEIALAGDGSWVAIRGNRYIASSGVDEELKQKLSEFFSQQRHWINARKREIREARASEERDRQVQEFATQRAIEVLTPVVAAIDRSAQERTDSEREAAARISSLEAKLEKRYLDDARDIKDMEESLQRRKQALLDEMPANIRSRSALSDDQESATNVTCVVCQVEQANFAVVPCGHVCLCSACSDICIGDDRPCPLCRVEIESTLRIYLGR